MDKQQAINIVRETFESPFEKGRFKKFVRNLLNRYEDAEITRTGNFIHDTFKNYISSYARLGEYQDEEGHRIDILIVYLKRGTAIEQARSMQRNFVAGYLQGKYGTNSEKDAALVAFVSPNNEDWRFSLVKLDVQLQETATGGMKPIDVLTPARRWSFLVGSHEKSHTAQTQFVPIIADDENNPSLARLEEAFNIETVTNEFFREYRRIFENAEGTLKIGWADEKKRLYTQRFFNRLMFVAFLERKGWLSFEELSGRKDYLRTLYEDYLHNETGRRAENFHKSRLNTLFFRGLNNPYGDQLYNDPDHKLIQRLIGNAPYLNGGLFEEEPEDIDGPVFPDEVIFTILNELVYQFNFTVNESTPLDVEVAVDPEMLGRIFEELVTGRHESGSYYTPKPVVAFMCREALKGYLETAMPGESAESLALFVDKNDASELRDPMGVMDALRAVKVCDPACGSGAYLLGMLHELLEQFSVIFAQHLKDAPTIYKTKLDIIQNNLYGVDKDDFAVNIARLRLWLSLIVDYEGETPPPLPNLDFKIESGDSLTAPDPSGGLQPDMFRQQQVQEFLGLKNEFLGLHGGSGKKRKLAKQIQDLRAKIEEWAHPKGYDKSPDSFDWQVDFAEVFAPELAQSTLGGKMAGIANGTEGQMELTAQPKEGGFDIVLANPPYVRQEEISNKPTLKRVFGEDTSCDVFNGRADLYVYFYARALQILKNCGVIAFISSDKFFSRGYAEKLRKQLSSKIQIQSITDFGEYPIFGATIETCIFIGQRQRLINTQEEFTFCRVESEERIADIGDSLRSKGWQIPQSRLIEKEWILAEASGFETLDLIIKNAIPLGEYVENKIFTGVKTGRNHVFIIDEETKNNLIRESKKSARVIKKWLVGNDIDNWGISWSNQHLIFAKHGFDLREYPSIQKYLKQHKQTLLERATIGQHEWYELQQPQMGIYEYFEHPKIVYQNVSRYYKFAYDTEGYYPDMNVFVIPTTDLYLLGVLSSAVVQYFAHKITDTKPGGFLVLKTMYVRQFPIPQCGEDEKKGIVAIVKKLIDKKADQVEKKELKKKLDRAIYEVFQLSSKQVSSIEELIHPQKVTI